MTFASLFCHLQQPAAAAAVTVLPSRAIVEINRFSHYFYTKIMKKLNRIFFDCSKNETRETKIQEIKSKRKFLKVFSGSLIRRDMSLGSAQISKFFASIKNRDEILCFCEISCNPGFANFGQKKPKKIEIHIKKCNQNSSKRASCKNHASSQVYNGNGNAVRQASSAPQRL